MARWSARRSSRLGFAAAVALGASSLAAPAVQAADYSPPAISMHFDATAIGTLNAYSILTITLSNPNGAELTGVGVTVNLSSAIYFGNPDSLDSDCSNWPSLLGSGWLSLSGITLGASSSCTTTIAVMGTGGAVQTAQSTDVSSTEGGSGASAQAFLYVARPAVTTAVFGDASIPYGGSTTLTFTITNPNQATLPDARPNAIGVYTGTLSDLHFTDTLPAGLVVATPNGLTGSCGGGTITAVAGSGSVALAGASLGDEESCTFSVRVTGVAAGNQQNSTGTVFADEGLGGAGTGSVVVGQAPAPSTPTPAVTPPAATTVGGGEEGGVPAVALLLLLSGWVGAAIAIRRLARARS